MRPRGPHFHLFCLLLAAAGLAACDSFDKEQGRRILLQRFCQEWPYGCTDAARIELGDVRETRRGRLVDFRVIDGEDSSGMLSAAYFEQQGDDWEFLLFEDPFEDRLSELQGQVNEEKKRLTDRLLDLKSAQNWHRSIYGRYATNFEELRRVNYKPGEPPVELDVPQGGSDWSAELRGRWARCTIDAGRRLPECNVPRPDPSADSGRVLAERLGGE